MCLALRWIEMLAAAFSDIMDIFVSLVTNL